MKKKLLSIATMMMFGVVVLLVLISATTSVFATATPFNTWTTDNENGWIKTSDSYTPSISISEIDGEPFRNLEYVYIDHEDYVYMTDSGHEKVFIFDNQLNYIDELEYDGNDEAGIDPFFAVNSVYVTEDKVYVADSFSAVVYIFDREVVLNRDLLESDYSLWFADTDQSGATNDNLTLSDGDLVYLADADTDEPIGEAVYYIEKLGKSSSNNDIIGFVDIATDELVFQKTLTEEMFGKVFAWTTADYDETTVYKLSVLAETIEPIQVISKPSAPVFQGSEDEIGYTFAPQRLVVDKRGNMYIVGARSSNGLIMLNEDGEFMTFFGGNPLRTPLIDQIRSLLLTEVQKEELREDSDIYIDYISSVAIDEKGFVYTVTSTLEEQVIKKFNVSGTNYFNSDAPGFPGATDLWVGNYGNVFIVEEYGWVTEYSANGELIFTFNVADRGVDRAGLLALPKSIAADSNDRLFIVDSGNRLLQVYEPTEFTNAIHSALQAYQDGDEDLAKELWTYSLKYATVFDIAHEGLGNALVRQDDYEGALREYSLAAYNEGISDTYWQVRQDWMEQHLDTVILGLLLLMIVRWFLRLLNKKYHYTKGLETWYRNLRKNVSVIDELSYIPTFIKHPLDGYYEIKRHNRVSVKTAGVVYILLAALYVFYIEVTNDIFLADPNINVLYRLIILGLILTLWVVANYFVCLIRDGEGSFKNVFVATAMSFTPLLLVVPVVTVLSNVLTYQEMVFYSVPLTFTFIWVTIYFFFMIKEIHNYEVGETFSVIFVSMFTMLIMGIFLFVIYSLNSQIFRVSLEISRELLER
ncbi:YIP1 family protein [Candidatus Xianfuyuplasma coldseepsis]|uniref:Yip1 domain-containing protein n=1 Tax=Candidatus Xianfuyuplasma coldseepsis TaxID=2782163 RepID=A0A7L7KND3_9MOLU|nr:YIP1 family protein [Xianfuyuplasma coldseepsis]QMS84221.1 hypothetical protein G4Z02_00180 [Xianfuyuplasma coldseepsis]